MSELRRQLEVESARDPVANAFHALACLTKADRQLVAARFNATYARATPAMSMTVTVEQ